jgi:CDP-4-dehydro-6-deoxyglucose reductase/ferredoxin-NAD(P)+ reductase (naphthalene dioxygenase ferredoxin-specific)
MSEPRAGRAPASPQPGQTVARVLAVEPATHDIVILRLRPESDFPFEAGQYAHLGVGDLAPRAYSLAGTPGTPDRPPSELAFYVRNSGSGVSAACRALAPGDTVVVEGPFGSAVLDPTSERPLLALAGGSGLASIGALVETALARTPDRQVRLYFGVRSARDLFDQARFDVLAARHPGFCFVPVLSEPRPADVGFRTGLVADAVVADLPDLSDWDAYLAGPKPMVAHARELLLGAALPAGRLHADSA